MRSLKAVIFDFYDTLTYADKETQERKINTCAKLCNVSAVEFSKAWNSLVITSNLGIFPKTEDRVRAVLEMLAVPEKREIIDSITKVEQDFLNFGVFLFDDAISTLLELRNMGLKLGLISNASPSVRIVLSNLRIHKYMDSVMISSDVGFRKPHARIYEMSLQCLGVPAQECAFVGDGNDCELDGAHNLGILTIWVRREVNKQRKTNGCPSLIADFTAGSLSEVLDIIRKMHI